MDLSRMQNFCKTYRDFVKVIKIDKTAIFAFWEDLHEIFADIFTFASYFKL